MYSHLFVIYKIEEIVKIISLLKVIWSERTYMYNIHTYTYMDGRFQSFLPSVIIAAGGTH